MKIKYLYTVLALCLICFFTVAAINSGDYTDVQKTNKDVIKFSHKTHKDITDCASCHTAVSESTSLKTRMLPEKSVCATCHDVNDDKNCTFCHYQDKFEPLIQKKSEIIFNHKFHLTEQKMICESCHKGLNDVNYSFESTAAKPSMMICTDCHNGTSVAVNDCESCHISTTHLLPADHKEVGFLRLHKFNALKEKSQCQMCHDNSFCESCHVSTTMITEKNTSRDFFTPYSPNKFIDNTKQQNLTRVHDLNFRFTHGIEAKGKTTQCATCHQTESFCVECHSSEKKDFALEGTMPASHKSLNFTTIGVGTGGGQHAALARRDIESCTACHDVQGSDPVCILCHTDPDGIKGNNPKTHAKGFVSNLDRGDWHTDFSSVCFTCHRDANARPNGIRGVGFCGYCHK